MENDIFSKLHVAIHTIYWCQIIELSVANI